MNETTEPKIEFYFLDDLMTINNGKLEANIKFLYNEPVSDIEKIKLILDFCGQFNINPFETKIKESINV